MKIASSLGMVEADPAPGPSSGTPQDDMTGWPGAICIAMTVVRAASPFWVAGLVGADRGRGDGGRSAGGPPPPEGESPSPQPSPVEGEGEEGPRAAPGRAGTGVGQQHGLPAGGHVGPPLRLGRATRCRAARGESYRRSRGESPSPQPSPVEGEGVGAPISIFPPNGGRGTVAIRLCGRLAVTRGASGLVLRSRWVRHRDPDRASAV